MPNLLRNKINLAFGIALLILLIISVLSFGSTLALLDSAEDRSSTEELITELQSVLAGLNAAEGAQRGYIISNDSAHIPRYNQGVASARASVDLLHARSARHPEVVAMVDSLDRLVEHRISMFERRLDLYHAQGVDALAGELKGDPEDAAVAALVTSIQTAARVDAADHSERAAWWGRRTLSVIALGGVFAILFLGISAYAIHRESNARAAAYTELHEQQLKNSQFLETLPLGVFVMNGDGTPGYSNRYARDLFGIDFDATAMQRAAYAYIAGTSQPYPPDRLPSVRALGGEACTVEDIEIMQNGVRIPLQVSAAPIYASDGTITSSIAAFTDISERRAIERLKDELISVVSHELRTPLTSIRGALGLVGSGRLGTLNDQGKRMIDIAVMDTDRLVRLINDMLDMERMESGRLELHKATANAKELIEHAVESVHAIADKQGILMQVDSDAVMVWCDADRIIQTLTNLIGNAIKFSPAGSAVKVTARSIGDHVEFRVTDQGRGIPADKTESIFDRFQQVDASDAREKGGAGLGLAISRNIVVQHGGRIWVESDGKTGSTFCFTIQRVATRNEEPADQQAGAVLIAEDDDNLAAVLSAQFDAAGLGSLRADNGTEAIRLAQESRPVLLVLDLGLPNRDGFDVVDWLRQHEQLRSLPVVVYTAKELADGDRDRLTLGPTVFMTKTREKPEDVVRSASALLNRAKTFSEA